MVFKLFLTTEVHTFINLLCCFATLLLCRLLLFFTTLVSKRNQVLSFPLKTEDGVASKHPGSLFKHIVNLPSTTCSTVVMIKPCSIAVGWTTKFSVSCCNYFNPPLRALSHVTRPEGSDQSEENHWGNQLVRSRASMHLDVLGCCFIGSEQEDPVHKQFLGRLG